MTGEAEALARRRRGRLILLGIAGLFLLSLLIAYGLIAIGWRPTHTGNYGELIQPPRPLVASDYTTLEGGRLEAEAIRGKWTYVTFANAECPKTCERNLYKMRQVVAAQGKEALRVQRWLVVTDRRLLDGIREVIKDYPGTQVIVGPPEAVRALEAQFEPPEVTGRIYLVDPLGNLMMRYPPDADANGMRKDLARLLRVSQIG
jgi:cytochrome oxidase Cu insertion factor (SCO1/SenC/PrrC family)